MEEEMKRDSIFLRPQNQLICSSLHNCDVSKLHAGFLLLLHPLESELGSFSISAFFLSGKNYGVGSLWRGLLVTSQYIYLHLFMKNVKVSYYVCYLHCSWLTH